MPAPIRPAAGDSKFASKEDVDAYLTKTIPLATAANPKYRGSEPPVLTQWLTKTVEFGPSSKPNGISVATSETDLEFRSGAQTATATPDVKFAIEDVRISERTDDPTLTENGEKTLGVIFNCQSEKSIATIWNGAPSKVDWSDISVQDPTLRAKYPQGVSSAEEGDRDAQLGARDGRRKATRRYGSTSELTSDRNSPRVIG